MVAKAEKNKINAEELEKIKVQFEEKFVNVEGELALVGKILISNNVKIDQASVYRQILWEANNRIFNVTIKNDLLKIKEIHIIDRKTSNFIRNAYFEYISDCKIKMFNEIEIFSKLEKDAFNNKELEINKKLMDVINNFEKMKSKEGLVEIKFNFILPAFRL